MPVSNSQIDRVGDRFRADDQVDDDDRTIFDSYRADFAPALREVWEIVGRETGLAPGSRLKTLETVVLKLKRQRTRLSQVSDIAGCRVVVETMDDQDEVVSRLRELFSGCQVKDFRDEPQWGYRAVHLIVKAPDGHLVEIQVRTRIQNIWANVSEAIAYSIDMDIKYGGGPEIAREILRRLSELGRTTDDQRVNTRALRRKQDEVEAAVESLLPGVALPPNATPEGRARMRAELERIESLVQSQLVDFEALARTLTERVGAV